MRFIDPAIERAAALLRRLVAASRRTVTGVLFLAGCSTPPPGSREPPPPAEPPPEHAGSASRADPNADANAARHGAAPPTRRPLPPASASRSWAELRLQAAHRLVESSPGASYVGTVPDTLLAIPVLEVELHADGSIRRIVVLRAPKQAQDTTQLAIAALHRAAPFGNVSHLPRPWRFTETFLFDDQRRFKPRTLD